MAFSKLYSSIVHSSLWTEPDHIRLLFITLLAIADREGYVYGSRRGLLRLANLDPDQCDQDDPFEALMSPDGDSSDLLRNPENEGKRIEEVPGGFRILNFLYYRGLRNEDERREQNREAQRRHREKVSQDKPASAKVSLDKQSPSASSSVSVSVSASGKGDRGKPSFDEVCAFFELRPQAQDFWDYYQSNGWRVGRNPMKDWKAAAARWQRNRITGFGTKVSADKPWQHFDKLGRRIDDSGRFMDANQVRSDDEYFEMLERKKRGQK